MLDPVHRSIWYSFFESQSLPEYLSEECIEGIGFGVLRTALGAVVFVAEVLAQERDVDDGAPWQVVVIGSGCEGDGIIIGAGACWFGTSLDMVRTGKISQGFVPPALGSPSELVPRPQSNALSDPGGELSGQP